jgi:hypothetical protein
MAQSQQVDKHFHAIERHPDYALQIGIITAEWSILEANLCMLLQHLLGVDDVRASAVFFSLGNNKARRDIVANLATAVLPPESDLRGRINSVVRRIQGAASRRNKIAHGMWGFWPGEADSGSLSGLDRKTGRLTGEWIRVRDLKAIRAQIAEASHEIWRLACDVMRELRTAAPPPS